MAATIARLLNIAAAGLHTSAPAVSWPPAPCAGSLLSALPPPPRSSLCQASGPRSLQRWRRPPAHPGDLAEQRQSCCQIRHGRGQTTVCITRLPSSGSLVQPTPLVAHLTFPFPHCRSRDDRKAWRLRRQNPPRCGARLHQGEQQQGDCYLVAPSHRLGEKDRVHCACCKVLRARQSGVPEGDERAASSGAGH